MTALPFTVHAKQPLKCFFMNQMCSIMMYHKEIVNNLSHSKLYFWMTNLITIEQRHTAWLRSRLNGYSRWIQTVLKQDRPNGCIRNTSITHVIPHWLCIVHSNEKYVKLTFGGHKTGAKYQNILISLHKCNLPKCKLLFKTTTRCSEWR